MKRPLCYLIMLAVALGVVAGAFGRIRQGQLDAAVLSAAYSRSAAKVEEAIIRGGSPNARVDYWWPLHNYSYSALGSAVEHNDQRVVEALLRKGADPNSTGRWFEPALSIAQGRKNQRIVALLRSHGATN